MRVEGRRQELNEGAILAILERVKLVYMCLPLITNLAEGPHSLAYQQKTPQSGLYLMGTSKIPVSLCIWVCKMVPITMLNCCWVPGTKTFTKGNSLSPGLMVSWLKKGRKKITDTVGKGELTTALLKTIPSAPGNGKRDPCYPRSQQNLEKVTGDKNNGGKRKLKKKTSKILVCVFPSSITFIAFIATGSAI